MRIIQKTIFIILLLTSMVVSENISHSINFVVGIPELVDFKYGLKLSRTSFYFRPGIGWYLFYMLNNDKGWEIAPEVSISYCLLNKGKLEIGPEIGFSYIYHNEYYNYLASSNYSEHFKTDLLFENIKAKFLWNTNKSNFFTAGHIGLSVIEEIYQGQITKNNITKHKTELTRTSIFPLLSIEIGRYF